MRSKKYFVYMLKDGDTVVYVGCTKDLKTRMKGHVKKVHNNVEVIPFRHKSEALRNERKILIKYLPKYNWIPEHVYQFRHIYLQT